MTGGLSQLIPFIRLLRAGDSFLMYPSGTRTRTGLFVEYRDAFREPGAVSLFLAQAQRRRPDVKVAAALMTRTYNPVKDMSAIVFCEPHYLPPGADRAAQREFDARLVRVMAEQVEINVPHVISALCYSRCLRRGGDIVSPSVLFAAAKTVFSALEGRRVDPAAETELEEELDKTLAFLAKKGALTRHRGRVRLNRNAILASPSHDLHYMVKNPVKHFVNQILHLPDVTRIIQNVAQEM